MHGDASAHCVILRKHEKTAKPAELSATHLEQGCLHHQVLLRGHLEEANGGSRKQKSAKGRHLANKLTFPLIISLIVMEV